MSSRTRKLLAGVALSSIATPAMAALIYTGDPVIETFDTLPNDPSQIPPGLVGPGVFNVPQLDGTPLPGWEMRLGFNTAGGVFAVDDGSSSAKNFVGSLGSVGSFDRALGSSDVTAVQHNQEFALVLDNGTSQAYDAFRLFYIGEHWRQWDETRNQTNFLPGLRFTYALGDDSATLTSATFSPDIEVLSLRPILPATGTGTPVDGNANLQPVGVDNFDETGILRFPFFSGQTWDPGERLILRWSNPNNGGNDDTLAIDDVFFVAIPVPEPSAAMMLVACAPILFRRRSR